MATAYRNTWLNWIERRLQISELNGGEFVFPRFYKYESVPLQIYLVQPDDGGAGPESFSRVDISNLALRITVNDSYDDPTPLAEQATWGKDTAQNAFYGVLDLNTSGCNAYVGSATTVSAYIQIAVSETGGVWRVVYQRQITVENSVAQPTSTSPDPQKNYRTAEESDGLYLSGLNRPGLEITLLSPSANWSLTIGIDDNGTVRMQPAPYPGS